MMAHSKSYPLELGGRGRLVLPAAVRRELDLSTGSRLVLTVEPDGSLRLTSARARADRLRGVLAAVSPERSLTEELMAERREEARAEADSG
jgi:AbrB family looped-hinge helix DNA binding protein